jgi:hypothetical protein
VMPNHPMINGLTLMAHAEEKKYPFSFASHDRKIVDRDSLKSFDFVVTKTGEDQGPAFLNREYEEARLAFEAVKPGFTSLQQLPLPDGSYLELFKKRSPALAVTPLPMHSARVVYGGAIELLGYDFRRVPDHADRYSITYYWRCVGSVGADYSVFVHLMRMEDAEVVAGQDHRLLDGAYPSSRWQTGEIFAEQYPLRLARGSYRLRIGLYRPEMSTRDPLYMLRVTAAAPGLPVENGSAALVGVVNASSPVAVGPPSDRPVDLAGAGGRPRP